MLTSKKKKDIFKSQIMAPNFFSLTHIFLDPLDPRNN